MHALVLLTCARKHIIPHSPCERLLILCINEVIQPLTHLADTFALMVKTPIVVEGTFRHLLGLADAPFPWHRLGQPYTADEMMRLLTTPPCTCSVDPRVVCDAHPCKCAKCHEHGRQSARCIWRQWALDTLHKHALGAGTLENLLDGCRDSLTYVQVLEAYGGHGPASSRERNMLNVISLMPSLQPIGSTNGIFDKTKTIGLSGLRSDGVAGTMLTGSTMWSLDDGGYTKPIISFVVFCSV